MKKEAKKKKVKAVGKPDKIEVIWSEG